MIANLIVDFFRNLAQQRVDVVVDAAGAKKMGAVARAKAASAKKFNAAVDAPLHAAKGALAGQKVPPMRVVRPQQEGDVSWFNRKKPAEVSAGTLPADQDKTAFVDMSQLGGATFQPCVGWVVVLTGEQRGRDFRLVDGRNTVGTAADGDVVLTDPYLSSQHCAIRHEHGVFTLVDLDSTNGTFLNGERATTADIIDNDKIRVGRTELKFKALE